MATDKGKALGRIVPYGMLLVILVIALIMRLVMVDETVVNAPVRADAAEYFSYAYNLRHHSSYSKVRPWEQGGQSKPVPDNHRNPGYVFFLTPFVTGLPDTTMLQRIALVQAFISTLTVLLTFLLARQFLRVWWSLAVALLVALSPHLVAVNIYMLTESLFTFMLVLFTWAIGWLFRGERSGVAIIVGVLLGATVLVRPTVLYLVWFVLGYLLLMFRAQEKAFRLGLVLLLGFVLAYGPWMTRNLVMEGDTSGNSLAVDTVHNGMYPGLMYKGLPESYGHPYTHIPDFDSVKSMSWVLEEVARRFREQPLTYAYWYFIEKPIIFLSWDIIQGMGDVFIYPVRTSPYQVSKPFIAVHAIMKQLHVPLNVLALAGILVAWLPRRTTGISWIAALQVRFCSVVLIYFLLVHIAGTPLPRYAIPIRPLVYGLAIFSIMVMSTIIGRWSAKHNPNPLKSEVKGL